MRCSKSKFPEIIFIAFLLISGISNAQKASISSIDSLIYIGLSFDVEDKDSLILIANQIKREGKAIKYRQGEIYYHRFMGWVEEYNGNFDQAIVHYLTFLEVAQTNDFFSEELQALNDLGSVYINTGRLEAAKEVFKEGLIKTDSAKRPARKSAFYNNLGIVFKRQQKIDSALQMYKKSLKIKEALKDSFALANLKINTASLLIQLKRYDEAEVQIRENIAYTRKAQKLGDLWHNLLNLANLKKEQKQYGEARTIAQEAMEIANSLESVKRIAETYFLQSMIEEGVGNYAIALDFERKASSLKQEFLNEESSSQIDQLREEFNAEQRERENALLNDKLNVEQEKQLYFWAGLLLLVILLSVIGFAWNKNRRKNETLIKQNELINKQKDKLTELNNEKNTLISIVSHDLRSPFNAISLWTETLIENLNKSPYKVAEATETIKKTAIYGQNLINDILDVEQMEINTHEVSLTYFNLVPFVEDLISDFEPAAKGKNIAIEFDPSDPDLNTLSDQTLLRRAMENLISNALKYTKRNSKAQIRLFKEGDNTTFEVIDEGTGIPKEDQHKLFSKYGQTSSKPTEGESSTGLGLTIVKRIMDELGGDVSFESETGKGSTFRLHF